MDKNNVIINLHDKIVKLHFKELDTDIDVDEYTSICYDNLYGEIVTVSALLNKIGILKAEFENSTKEEKLSLQIYEAELRRVFRSKCVGDQKKPTLQEIDDHMLLDQGWQNKKKKLIRVEKELAYIDSLYWAVQSKDKKLSVLMKGITPEEFERDLLEGKINGIMIKKHDKIIK